MQTGVKSLGCENRTAQESPIQSWKRIRPWLVSASKSGAVSLIFIGFSSSYFASEKFFKFRSESQHRHTDAEIFQKARWPENKGAQFVYDAISSQNLFRSMLPPETMATIVPLPAFPVSAAASGNAPAPSEMTRAFSAISRIALFVSSRVTTM